MPMLTKTIEEAIDEAKRFIKAAETLVDMQNAAMDLYSNPREQGAVKRASMDLTRKLADLRAGR